MTIRVDIDELADLAEFLAHLETGEDVELTRDGEVLAIATPASGPGKAWPKRDANSGSGTT